MLQGATSLGGVHGSLPQRPQPRHGKGPLLGFGHGGPASGDLDSCGSAVQAAGWEGLDWSETQIGSFNTRETLAGVEGMAGEPKWSRRGAAAGRRCSDGDGEVISILLR